jgi:hypothetical protein
MAAMMKITPYFLPLKLLAMSCVIASLAVAYWIVRRFVPPPQAMGIILLTGILSHVYPATYWLISEGLFCLVSTAALLLAMQIREGREQWWRIFIMAALCSAAVLVRWAGLLGFLLVAAALMEGRIRFRLSRREIFLLAAAIVLAIGAYVTRTSWYENPNWSRAAAIAGIVVLLAALIRAQIEQSFSRQIIAVALAAAFTAVTFVELRIALQVTPQQAAAAKAYGGDAEDTGTPSVANADTQVMGNYKMVTGTEQNGYVDRAVGWGRWFSFLFWQPFRAAAGSKLVSFVGNGVGWMVIALVIVTAVLSRRLLWLAVLLYCAGLAMNWPQVTARYLVPVAFLILLAVVMGMEYLRARFPWKRLIQGALIAFVVSVAMCNGALYAVEVAVARSHDFYATYEAGLSQNLIAAAHYLDGLNVGDNQIAVSGKYTNLNRTRSSPFGLRATTMLTGKEIVSVPWKLCLSPTTATGLQRKPLFRYLRNNGIKYYLFQPPVSPWRIWHFRAGWWEKRRTGVTTDPRHDESGWRLYRVDADDEKLAQVDFPPSHDWPTRVPGLDKR